MRQRKTSSLNHTFLSFAGLLAFFLMVSFACKLPFSQFIQTGSGEEMTSSVGTEGGTVVGPGEVELVIPEDAFTHSTEITIQEVATAPRLPKDADIHIAGKPVEITFSTQAEADAVFELVLPLEREEGAPDDQYTVLRWDGARWTTAGGFVEGDHIQVWTNQFSIFMPARVVWVNRPVSFVNNGPYNALVMPWTYQPFDPSVNEEIPPDFSTVSIAPGGPGLWPNPSRFLSLPLGIYTFCIEWDEDQDMDNDGYIEVYHFILEGPSADLPLHVDENDSTEIAFAEEVQFRTDPIEKFEGECGSSVVADNGDEYEVDELPEGEGENGGKSEPVPAGTYIGDSLDVPADWELVEDEFIVEVAEDGTVTGSRIYIIKRESVGPICTRRWENGHTTILSGHISGVKGYVKIDENSYTISDESDCGRETTKKTYESVCDKAQITISGEQMEISGDGSSDCGSFYTATKQ